MSNLFSVSSSVTNFKVTRFKGHFLSMHHKLFQNKNFVLCFCYLKHDSYYYNVVLVENCFNFTVFFFNKQASLDPHGYSIYLYSVLKLRFTTKILNLKSRSTIIYFKPQKIGKSSPCINI